MPRTRSSTATAGPTRPAKPQKLKVRRTTSGLKVTWKALPSVRRYRMKVALSDGRTFIVLPKGRATSATVPEVAKTIAVRVSLQGEKADGTTGPAATAQLKRAKAKRR